MNSYRHLERKSKPFYLSLFHADVYSTLYMCSGNSSQDASDYAPVWSPPVQLQKRYIELTDSVTYTLFFPLELTSKDYVRRILDLITIGIRSQVHSISRDFGLASIEAKNQRDLYYLLRQILGYSDTDSSKRQLHQRKFEEALKIRNKSKLFYSAEYLYQTRVEFFQYRPDRSFLEDMNSLFEAARNVLECFGKTASKALMLLDKLQKQYQIHRVFKERRINASNWCIDEEEIADDFMMDEDEEDADSISTNSLQPPNSQNEHKSSIATSTSSSSGMRPLTIDTMNLTSTNRQSTPRMSQTTQGNNTPRISGTPRTTNSTLSFSKSSHDIYDNEQVNRRDNLSSTIVNSENKNTPISSSTIAWSDSWSADLIVEQGERLLMVLSHWQKPSNLFHIRILSRLLFLCKEIEIVKTFAVKKQDYTEANQLTELLKDLHQMIHQDPPLSPVHDTSLVLSQDLLRYDINSMNRIDYLQAFIAFVETFLASLWIQEEQATKRQAFMIAEQCNTLATKLCQQKDALKEVIQPRYTIDTKQQCVTLQGLMDAMTHQRDRKEQQQLQQPQEIPFFPPPPPTNPFSKQSARERLLLHVFEDGYSFLCLALYSEQPHFLTTFLSPTWLNMSKNDRHIMHTLIHSPIWSKKYNLLKALLQPFPSWKKIGFPISLFSRNTQDVDMILLLLE